MKLWQETMLQEPRMIFMFIHVSQQALVYEDITER